MTEHTGELVEIRDETLDVRTFRIKLDDKVNFISGQYCMVSIPGSNVSEKKPLTFVNSPTEKGYVELTVKKIGKFTSSLFELKPGDELKIDGPMGENLNFDGHVKEDVVFIAGGSGITPFISSIRYAVAKGLSNHIILFFSNRSAKDIIYSAELQSINKDNITIISTLSNEWPKDWKGETGWIDKAMITKYVKNPEKKIWYLCGPPPMVHAMLSLLHEMGISDQNIRVEHWEIPGKQRQE